MAVNDSHEAVVYRQAAIWFSDLGVQALSGVLQVEANAPYALWLDRVFAHLSSIEPSRPRLVSASDLPPELASEWADWLPAHAVFFPVNGGCLNPDKFNATTMGGVLFARDFQWSEQERALLAEWLDVWGHAWRALTKPAVFSLRRWRLRLMEWVKRPAGLAWWKHQPFRLAGLIGLFLFFPVRLTVLAPGELVPANPAVVRAPLDGVIDTFHVQPNQSVKKGQPLFGFDEVLLQSKLDVARQSLATADAEYKQTLQQALVDGKSKAQLAVLTGKIEEKRAEANFIADQMERARVLAPQDGIVLFDDPSEWIGRPVSIGERIMRLASPDDAEVEAWLPVADAIPLEVGASVDLYLNASPLSPVDAKLRYVSHEAVQRPDGSYGYRVRAQLDGATSHRVGLKGTAKLYGHWVILGYWISRRPLASIRSTIGW